jgi:hypothetical protein
MINCALRKTKDDSLIFFPVELEQCNFKDGCLPQIFYLDIQHQSHV